MLIPAAGFTFYKGYSGACKRPKDSSTIMWYCICQIILSIIWLVFSIIMAGSFDGWLRIRFLKGSNEGSGNFCIFLCVVESLGYTASAIIGVISICRISNVCLFYYPFCRLLILLSNKNFLFQQRSNNEHLRLSLNYFMRYPR